MLEVLNDRPARHHPAGREDDARIGIQKYGIALLSRIYLLAPRGVEWVIRTTFEHLPAELAIQKVRVTGVNSSGFGYHPIQPHGDGFHVAGFE